MPEPRDPLLKVLIQLRIYRQTYHRSQKEAGVLCPPAVGHLTLPKEGEQG